jgi:hypothetical protein
VLPRVLTTRGSTIIVTMCTICSTQNSHEIATAFLECAAKHGGGMDSADDKEYDDVGSIENENKDDDEVERWDGSVDL